MSNSDVLVNNINYNSISSGPLLRTELFLQGCNHNCPGCFSEETHEINDDFKVEFSVLESFLFSGHEEDQPFNFSICGGEPLLQFNETMKLCDMVKEKFPGNMSHILLYSGYSYQEIIQNLDYKKLFQKIDMLVEGRYIENLNCMNKTTDFIGSSNQNLYIFNKYSYVVSQKLNAKDANKLSKNNQKLFERKLKMKGSI